MLMTLWKTMALRGSLVGLVLAGLIALTIMPQDAKADPSFCAPYAQDWAAAQRAGTKQAHAQGPKIIADAQQCTELKASINNWLHKYETPINSKTDASFDRPSGFSVNIRESIEYLSTRIDRDHSGNNDIKSEYVLREKGGPIDYLPSGKYKCQAFEVEPNGNKVSPGIWIFRQGLFQCSIDRSGINITINKITGANWHANLINNGDGRFYFTMPYTMCCGPTGDNVTFLFDKIGNGRFRIIPIDAKNYILRDDLFLIFELYR